MLRWETDVGASALLVAGFLYLLLGFISSKILCLNFSPAYLLLF